MTYDVYATKDGPPQNPGDEVHLTYVCSLVAPVGVDDPGAAVLEQAAHEATLGALRVGGLVALPQGSWTRKLVTVSLADPPAQP